MRKLESMYESLEVAIQGKGVHRQIRAWARVRQLPITGMRILLMAAE
jgi:hypothetical protein